MTDYQFEQNGRRPIVMIAAVLGVGMIGVGVAYNAPWYFLAMPGIASLMALLMLIQNSRSGLKLTAESLTLYKDSWQEVIPLSTITGLRTTLSHSWLLLWFGPAIEAGLRRSWHRNRLS
jgi:hypothetical protein